MTEERTIEMKIALSLSQIEGAFSFLDYINNAKDQSGEDVSRNVTERNVVETNLDRIKTVRLLYKQLINKQRLHQ
tara:strand:- start:253 stop:477 length:225 start_codon:yes stop_codon:yes gene_type:complete